MNIVHKNKNDKRVIWNLCQGHLKKHELSYI